LPGLQPGFSFSGCGRQMVRQSRPGAPFSVVVMV
jgi:hypothetical protein